MLPRVCNETRAVTCTDKAVVKYLDILLFYFYNKLSFFPNLLNGYCYYGYCSFGKSDGARRDGAKVFILQ